MTSALMRGGRQHFGWGIDRHMSADTFDALNANTRATGNWEKGKAPKFPLWPRPDVDKKKPDKTKPKTTVAELFQRFQRG